MIIIDMKKVLVTIGIAVIGMLGWFFYEKPQPPFGADPTSNELTYFAEIDNDGVVLRVIVISQENIDTGRWGDPDSWVQTSKDGNIRKNYAGKGHIYDKQRDAFIAPEPPDATGFDEVKARWIVPKVSPLIKISE